MITVRERSVSQLWGGYCCTLTESGLGSRTRLGVEILLTWARLTASICWLHNAGICGQKGLDVLLMDVHLPAVAAILILLHSGTVKHTLCNLTHFTMQEREQKENNSLDNRAIHSTLNMAME